MTRRARAQAEKKDAHSRRRDENARSADHTRKPSRTPSEPRRLFPLETHRAALLLVLLALVLKSLIFAPIGIWPLAFVCLVPWMLMIGGATHAPRVYLYSFLFGLAFFLLNMRWLYPATGVGYMLLAVYEAFFFLLIACPLRHAVRRRRWPLAVALPLVWVGSEFVRAVAFTGFPWFFLSHSLSGVRTLIQVSDLVGAYGTTFMVAAVNGAIADLLFIRYGARGAQGEAAPASGVRSARFSVMFALAATLGTWVYGQVQLRRDTLSEGPRIAIIQGDFLSTVFVDELQDHDRATDGQKRQIYFEMMEAAAADEPDLVLLPETPWIMYLNPWKRDAHPFFRESFAQLQEYATRNGTYVVTGSASEDQKPEELVDKSRKYNSATVFYPDGSEPGRYDKRHLVPFGEYVPFRYGRFRFLYFWMNAMMPFSGPDGKTEYSFFAGEEFRAFAMKPKSRPSDELRFGIPICYEDVMPYVAREFTCGGTDEKQVDFLLNISNDGWFGRGIQQPQHLAASVFRAVENRVGIARAVNTGVSAFIDPTGRVHDVVTGDPSTPWPGVCGYAVAPVWIDSRLSFYSRFGDWFGWTCALAWLAMFLDYWVHRARTPKADGALEGTP